jgi:biopolymer transport protein ExbD
MSHGSTDKCEPNMTPLLDLVLQLVMFFMLCANFVMEQTNVSIKLPEAVSAKALDKDVSEVLFLNVNAEGSVLLAPVDREGDTDHYDNPIELKGYLERRAAIEKRRTGKPKPEATIVLRVDKTTHFEKTYAVMKACRLADYSKVELRAIRYSGVE